MCSWDDARRRIRSDHSGDGVTDDIWICKKLHDTPVADTRRRKTMKGPTKANVLFVDDDADTRELVTFTLNQAGINVIPAETVAEAREAALAEDIDLYLLDGLIPNGDSLKLCSDLRMIEPNKPIVFYSGLAFKEAILRGLAAGATGYLVKPYSGDLAEEILRFIHTEFSSNAVQPLFLNREAVMEAFEREAESVNGESVKIVDVPDGFIPMNWTRAFEVPQTLIPVRSRNARTMRSARGIF